MRVLLISANTETINMPVLPLGLTCIARAAKSAGHDVRIVNTLEKDMLNKKAAQAIDDFNPEVIGISVRNIDDQSMAEPRFLLEPVKSLVETCRKHTSVPVVTGGAGYSIFPEAALSYTGADMGIRGPGEKPFVELLDAIKNSKNPEDINGVYMPGKKYPKHLTRRDQIDEFPFPSPEDQDFSQLDQNAENLWIPFQTRRGCPMNCSYCSTSSIEGSITTKRDTDRVADTLQSYLNAGFSKFYFVDNTFNIPSSYAGAVCNKIIERKLEMTWRCIFYPWKVEKELIEKMASAGCIEVGLGFESGSDRILKELNKKFNKDDVRKASEFLKKCNIRRNGFLLLGGPGETEETVNESLEFMEELNPEGIKITWGIRIYPGTVLAGKAVEAGLIAEDDDLLMPRFYMSPEIRDKKHDILNPWMEKYPHWFS